MPIGENSGGFTMKQPKLDELKISNKGTKQIRDKMARADKIKITVNIDADIIYSLKKTAEETGVPYQTLLNRVLRVALEKHHAEENRLNRIEREIETLKKKIAVGA